MTLCLGCNLVFPANIFRVMQWNNTCQLKMTDFSPMFLCCATLKEHAVPLSHWVGSCRHQFPDEPTQIVNHRATSSLTRYLPATLRTTQCCIVEESCHVQAIQHLHDSPMCSAQTPPSSMALPELSRPEFNNMATGWVSKVIHTWYHTLEISESKGAWKQVVLKLCPLLFLLWIFNWDVPQAPLHTLGKEGIQPGEQHHSFPWGGLCSLLSVFSCCL